MADRPILKFIGGALAGRSTTIPTSPAGTQNIIAIGNLFAGAANVLSARADAVIVQDAREAGALAGFGGNPDFKKGVGLRAQAHNDAARSSLLLRMNSDTDVKLRELFQANQADTQTFVNEASAFTEEAANKIAEFDEPLAEMYRLKATTEISRISMGIAKTEDRMLGMERAGDLVRAEQKAFSRIAQTVDDITGDDVELAEASASSFLQEAGAILANSRTQMFADGTPMRTPVQIARQEAALSRAFSTEFAQSMIQGAADEAEIREIVRMMKDNTLEIPIIEYTENGPSITTKVPLGIFDTNGIDSLEKFALSELRDRDIETGRANLEAKQAFNNRSVEMLFAVSQHGASAAGEIDPIGASEADVLRHENNLRQAITTFDAREELEGKTLTERSVIIGEAQNNAKSVPEIERLLALGKANEQLAFALSNDPAAEMIRQNLNIGLLSGEARVEALDHFFAEHGLVKSERKYATKSQVASISRTITDAEDGPALIEVVQSVMVEFGAQGQSVINQGAKEGGVNPQVGVLANMTLRDADGELNPIAVRYANSLRMKKLDGSPMTKADFAARVGDDQKVKDIDDVVFAELDEFRRSFSFENSGVSTTYEEAVSWVSYLLAATENKKDSARNAIKAVLPYEFEEANGFTVRIPKNLGEQGVRDVRIAVSNPHAVFDIIVARGAFFDPGAGADLNDFERDNAAVAQKGTTARLGSLITSPTEDGLAFLDAHGQILRDVNRNIVVVEWDELGEIANLSTLQKEFTR